MKDPQVSRTAWTVAMSRAGHQLFDEPPIFADPIAIQIIGPAAQRRLLESRDAFQSVSRRMVRAALAVRSRYCEEAIADAIRRGVGQIVILGAGFDTFAYRNQDIAARVFEVDYPATQVAKRRHVAAAGLAAPEALTFVPVDFDTTELGEALVAGGFDPAQQSFVSWLGVTYYLSSGVVLSTLAALGSLLAPESEIVFDYFAPPAAAEGWADFLAMAKKASAVGEPWQCLFEPPLIADQLARMGMDVVEDLGKDDLGRYFADRSDGLTPFPLMRILRAAVRPPAPSPRAS